MGCGVGCRCSSDLALLWLWHRPAATALIEPLVWEPPCARGAALKRQRDKKKKKREREIKKLNHRLRENICKSSFLVAPAAYGNSQARDGSHTPCRGLNPHCHRDNTRSSTHHATVGTPANHISDERIILEHIKNSQNSII